MKQFLKDNIAIVAAITLPVILVLVFALSSMAVNRSVSDPQYDFLIATNYNEGNNEAYYYDVVQNQLKVTYAYPVKNQNGGYEYTNTSKLWRVRVPAMTIEEITLVPPSHANNESGKRVTLDVPALAGLHVSSAEPSPDGYMFQQTSDSYDSNLMMEMFSGSGSRYRNICAIVKDHRTVPVKSMNGEYNSYNTHFVAWILKN